MRIRSNNVCITPCAPLSEYPEAPKDQSSPHIVDCPHCDKPMWMTVRKKAMMDVAERLGKDNIVACYTCMREIIKENPYILDNAKHIRLDE